MILYAGLLCVQAQEKPKLKIGGALRFTYSYSNWKQADEKRGGELGYDVFRLNISTKYKRIALDADYRFYTTSSGGDYLKRAVMEYAFSQRHKFSFGLIPVNFGLMPMMSNNFYCNLNYFLGLEEDDDMGIKYAYQYKEWELTTAFFKNADLFDGGENRELSPNRYASDVVGRNKETNTFNLQAVYHFGYKQQLGVSTLVGGLYNLDTQNLGSRFAGAIHYSGAFKSWSLKAQYTYYNMSPRNKKESSADVVMLGSYGSAYKVASKGETYTLGLKYTLSFREGLVKSLEFYNDFSMLRKSKADFANTYENVLGCLLTAGPICVYIDYIVAKNHAWIGINENAFAAGDKNAAWHSKWNINVGYYF